MQSTLAINHLSSEVRQRSEKSYNQKKEIVLLYNWGPSQFNILIPEGTLGALDGIRRAKGIKGFWRTPNTCNQSVKHPKSLTLDPEL